MQGFCNKFSFMKIAMCVVMLVAISILNMPSVFAKTGYTELTGGVSLGKMSAIDTGVCSSVVNNHQYIAAVFGTGGWASGNCYNINNFDYRSVFDSAVGDDLYGAYHFDGAKLGFSGVEFKAPQRVTMIGYMPRTNANANRLNGAYFQGSNDGKAYTTLFTINDVKASGYTYKSTDNGLLAGKAYKYFRITGNNGMPDVLNIAELKLYTDSPGYGAAEYRVAPPSGAGVNGKFNLVRNASNDPNYDNVVILTYEAESKSGAAWANQKVDLTRPFNIETYVHLYHKQGFITNKENDTYRNGGLADGLTFTLQNDNAGAICNNSVGGLLGAYGTINNNDYIKKALSIELDTKLNTKTDTATGMEDPGNASTAHIAVLTPKSAWITANDHKNIDYFTASAKWYPFNISWSPVGEGGTLTYEFDGKTYTYNVNSCTAQFGGTEAYWGFTAATAWGSAVHAVAMKTFPVQLKQDCLVTVTHKLETYPGSKDYFTYTTDQFLATEGDIIDSDSFIMDIQEHFFVKATPATLTVAETGNNIDIYYDSNFKVD